MNYQSSAGLPPLGELYTHFHPRVQRLCLYLLGSLDEAEDAASEIFARLPRSLASYDPAQPFERWLSRVASNYCVDVLRRRRSEQRIFVAENPAASETEADSPSPLQQLLTSEKSDVVRQAMARLPEHYRQPLMLRYWHELGYHEIAKKLGLTRANVATLIHRATKALRSTLVLEGSRGGAWALSPTR